jgi:hypothetical protein
MTVIPRADPLISGVSPEFTVAKSMVAALFAGACRGLAQAAASGEAESPESVVDPRWLVWAQLEEELWLGVARFAQREALEARGLGPLVLESGRLNAEVVVQLSFPVLAEHHVGGEFAGGHRALDAEVPEPGGPEE